MDKNYEEVPKYIKKKESNVSKSSKKAKHKHNYLECLCKYKWNFNGKIKYAIYSASYCSICGKLGDKLKNTKIEKNDFNCIGTIDEKIYEKYKDKIPLFEVEQFKTEYIDLNVADEFNKNKKEDQN